jgi:hypothetical protein
VDPLLAADRVHHRRGRQYILLAEFGLCALIVLSVIALMLNFIIRYHHGSNASRAGRVEATWHYEIA